jgi:hypothetical protein
LVEAHSTSFVASDAGAVFAACIREQGTARWDKAEKDGVFTVGVVRSIEFTEEMALAKLLLPRDGSRVKVPCNAFVVPIRTPTGWRVAAEPSIGLTGASKLVKGTIDLQVGDVVLVNLNAHPPLGGVGFPRTPDGWTSSMLGKFLLAKGYRTGDLYYFKGSWETALPIHPDADTPSLRSPR